MVHKLTQTANLIRQDVISMLTTAGSGHSAGSLGMADIFTSIYFGQILNLNPKKPLDPDRDYVILSNGHICPVLYATLARRGYFDPDRLSTLRQLDSGLEGHPHRGDLPGIENTSGPLGLGLSQACGLALGLRTQRKKNRVICLLSDGEHQEGQTWEAYMFGAKEKLENLLVLIDRNQIQISGPTEKVMPIDPLADKLNAFGWRVEEIDGHNFSQILQVLQNTQDLDDRPRAVICHTIPGKGVSFMENKYEWHGKPPSKEEAKLALEELRKRVP